MKQTIILRIAFIPVIALAGISCRKFVEVDPPETYLTTPTLFSSDATADAALTGLLERAVEFYYVGDHSITLYMGLAADELKNLSVSESQQQEAYSNQVLPNGVVSFDIWNNVYKDIYGYNSIIKGVENSTGISAAVKARLLGEAKFLRAYCFFYLANTFGDVPLVLTTDYRQNAVIARTAKDKIYDQVVADLKEAETLLTEAYYHPQRSRPNKWAARAFLARVYLYQGKWADAENYAGMVINNTGMYNLEANLDNVFLNTSKETIWNVQCVEIGLGNLDARSFVFTSSQRRVAMTDELRNAFEPADNRKAKWVSSRSYGSNEFFFAFKYKLRLAAVSDQPSNEYPVLFRLAEQYLVRAEARAQLNKLTGPGSAAADIDVIRSRAGLGGTTATTQAQLLSAIEQERRVELFTEWGHRWYDLQRWNRATAVLGPLKAPNWQPTDVLFPIPQSERNLNPNLTQNEGY